MKTRIGKIAVVTLLSMVFILPQFGKAQDNNLPPGDTQGQYQNPPDTPPGQDDQQLDAQEQQQAAPPDNAPVTTQVFYDQLSPYGQWVNYGSYGYVWIPSATPNFVPYSTEGHWVYTDYGWTWVSDYPWGWATFHYGRWSYDDSYGWFWVPDVTWGPAWVCWRHSEGYYGWAPLCPGVDISIGYNWNLIPANYWCFVNERYIGDRYVWRHYEPRVNNITYIRNSTVIHNTYVDNNRHVTYAAGPRREEVEGVLHTTIRPVPIHESTRPEQRYDQAHLHLYRPTISNEGVRTQPAPATHVEIRDVPQRNVPNRQAPTNWRSAPQSQTHWNQPQRQQFQQPARSAPAARPAPANNGGGGRRR